MCCGLRQYVYQFLFAVPQYDEFLQPLYPRWRFYNAETYERNVNKEHLWNKNNEEELEC